MKPQTTDIFKYVQEATRVDSDNARLLAELIKDRFLAIIDAVENNDHLLSYVSSLHITDEAKGHFCDKLIGILVPGKKVSIEQLKSEVEAEVDEEYTELYGAGERLLHLQKGSWWAGDMSNLAEQTRVFFGKFMKYHEDIEPDSEDIEPEKDDVRVYTSHERGERNYENAVYNSSFEEDDDDMLDDDDIFEEENDETMTYILPHEAEVIANLLLMISAYMNSLDNQIKTKNVRRVLVTEKKRKRWDSITSIMEDIQDLLDVGFMLHQLNKHNPQFSSTMLNLKERYTTFCINLDK